MEDRFLGASTVLSHVTHFRVKYSSVLSMDKITIAFLAWTLGHSINDIITLDYHKAGSIS